MIVKGVEHFLGWDGTPITRLDLDDATHLYAAGGDHPFRIAAPGDHLTVIRVAGGSTTGEESGAVIGVDMSTGWGGDDVVRVDIRTGFGTRSGGLGDCHWYLGSDHPYADVTPVAPPPGDVAGDLLRLSLAHAPAS